jgi:hypothetical protein
METEPFLRLVHREVSNVQEVTHLLTDERSRLLAYRLNILERRLNRLNRLVNPPVQLPSKKTLSEDELAQIQKTYYALKRNQLVTGFSKLIESFILICDVMFTADPIVEVETELSKNLQSSYKTLLTLIEKVTDALTNLVDVARYPDEILKATGTLQTEWKNLYLTTKHIIITPLKTAIAEEARRELITRILQGRLGR